MMDTTVAAIKLATTCASYEMTPAEITEVLLEAGYSREATFLAVSARNVLGPDYVCVPERGDNRREACVQVLSA